MVSNDTIIANPQSKQATVEDNLEVQTNTYRLLMLIMYLTVA